MTTHRLYTQDKGREAIYAILDKRFDSYTVVPTLGVWKGKHEKSLVIEVIGASLEQVQNAAKNIAQATQQESVLLQSFDSKVEFLLNPTTQVMHLMSV